jgi:Uncharacterized protein probably involved in high-affinity Fe2+ transport
MQESDEATPEQLNLAKEQGRALQQALDHMVNKEAHDGGEIRAGDYRIGYAVERAEGMYHMRDGKLEWEEPDEENVHVEVSVRDGADGRFVPGLNVYATLIDDDGNEVGTHQQPFLWHPWLYHYGRNWQVPGDGEYTIRVHIEPPEFGRHDKKNGNRFAEPVEVEFTGVKIKTGKK